MSAVNTSCMPCAATPIAPQAQVAATPAPGSAAATSAPDPIIGGGSAAATYAPMKDAASPNQYVPAPAAGASAPDPIAAPTTQTAAPSTIVTQTGTTAPAGSASALPTWPQWQAEFTKLGVSATDVARIGAQQLSNEQLAQVFERIQQGATQGTVTPTPTTSVGNTAPNDGTQSGSSNAGGWDPSWEAKFQKLGIPAADIAQLAKAAQAKHLTNADLEKVYAAAVQQVQGGTTPSQTAGAGWSDAWAQKFSALGMPAELVAEYQKIAKSEAGTTAAYNIAAERLQDFTQRGWTEKFTQAGVDPQDMWAIILTGSLKPTDPPLDDKQLQAIVDNAKSGKLSTFQKSLQLGISFFPGGQLLQYVFGHEFVSGTKIDQTNPMNVGLAALSGLALFASIRGVGNLAKSFGAAKGGYESLFKVGDLTAGKAVAADTKLGEILTWGAGKKLKAILPFTMEHKMLIGAGHAEAAAKAAISEGGIAKLLKAPNGELVAGTLNKMFDEIKTGQRVMVGSSALFGMPTKMSVLPMSTSVAKDGTQLINVARTLRIGDGRTQLAALAGVAGDLAAARNPALTGLGSLMASTVANSIGFSRTDGVMATWALGKAAKLTGQGVAPSWYKAAADAARTTGGGTAFTAAPAAAPTLDVKTGGFVERAVSGSNAVAYRPTITKPVDISHLVPTPADAIPLPTLEKAVPLPSLPYREQVKDIVAAYNAGTQ